MLEIYIYGPTENGFLDLEPGTKLQIEENTEIFDEDLSTGEFSLPVATPWTPKNRRILGFAERITNAPLLNPWYRCDVYSNGFVQMLNAKYTIIDKTGDFAYTSGTFNASVSNTKGLFGSYIKNKTMQDFAFGGRINFGDDDSRTFARKLMQGQYPQYNYIAFAPVGIENFIDKGRSDYDGEFVVKDTVNYYIVTGSGANDWTFARPNPDDGITPVASGAEGYIDYRTVPFFNLKYVLRKIFEENNFVLKGEWMDDQAFDELFLFNNCSLENYAPTVHTDFNRVLIPSNHFDKTPVKDFLKAIFDFYGIYPVFTGQKECVLMYRKKRFTEKKVYNANPVCSRLFTATPSTDATTKTGYTLKYGWDGADQFYSEQVKELKEKTLVATVQTYGDLLTLDISRPFTTDDVALVQALNTYFVVADGTSDPVKWEPYSQLLDDYVVTDGERTVDMTISTLCNFVQFNESTALQEIKNYLGTRQPGTYINNKGAFVLNSYGIRLFYIKKFNIGGAMVPLSFYHSRDENNIRIVPYSLSWHGEDGMAKNFHTHWQALKSKYLEVKTKFKVNEQVIKDLKENNTIEIGGVHYIASKYEKTLPLDNDMEVYLVPL